MDPKVQEVLAQFDEVHAEVVQFVRGCSEHEWRELTTVEGWPVGVVAHHIAVGYTTAMGWIDHLRRGEPVPGDEDSHDEGNARHAARFASTTRDETLADLEANAAAFRRFLAGVRTEELPMEAAHGPAGGVVISVERMIGATARHPRFHLDNMRRAVNADAEQAS